MNSEVQQAGSTCEGSEDGKYDVTFIFDITLGNKEYEECEIDSDCPTDDICHQITGTCMQQPIVYIYDRNNIPYACNDPDIITLQAISGTSAEKKEKRLANIAECEKCPNRELVDEIYCAPRCRAGEFLNKAAKCVSCSNGGPHHDTVLSQGFCDACGDVRMHVGHSWGGGGQCIIASCGERYISTLWGCRSCEEKGNISGVACGYGKDNVSGCTTRGFREQCRACKDPTRVVIDNNQCKREVCTSDYFLSSDEKSCLSCTEKTNYNIINNAKQRDDCLACEDENGNKNRRLNGQWCVLASQCPYGTQEDDPSTSDVDESIYCAECPENTFPAKNQCVSCDECNGSHL